MNKYPPLTDAERARMVDDYSDAAVERWAQEMKAREHPQDAVERAQQYRTGHHDGTPGAAFWSRVIARLLCLPDRAATTIATSPSTEAILRDGPVEEIRAVAPLERMRPPACSAYPSPQTAKPKKGNDPEQGSLF